MTSSIRESALLVHPRTKQWSSTKSDPRIREAAAAKHGVASGAVRGGQKLLVGDKLDAVRNLFKAADHEHLALTAPWMDSGPRIIAAAGYAGYMEKMRAAKDAIDRELEVFVAWYRFAYVSGFKDQRADLNGLFSWEDYPHPDTMAERFALDVLTLPLPSAEDFRVDLGAQQTALIRAQIEREVYGTLELAARDVVARVCDVAGHLAERMRAYDPSGDRVVGKFHDTLIGNVRELVAALPGLTLPGLPLSPALAAAGSDLEQLLALLPGPGDVAGKDAAAAELRDNDALRLEVAAEAESILSRMAEYV